MPGQEVRLRIVLGDVQLQTGRESTLYVFTSFPNLLKFRGLARRSLAAADYTLTLDHGPTAFQTFKLWPGAQIITNH